MKTSWVIGSHGLLGTALSRKLPLTGCKLFAPGERFDWSNESILSSQFASAIQKFSFFTSDAQEWQIFWAAGISSMGTPADHIIPEAQALRNFLKLIGASQELISKPGAIVFASSAGAIYAGSSDYQINENSLEAPTTPYAHEKIIQEKLVSSFISSNKLMTGLLARLSTIYGTDQSFNKRQGLLTYIARQILINQPVNIYVPFDTIRDYITSDDAASIILSSINAATVPGVYCKIIASEKPTTIAEIISTFKRIVRRAPKIVTCTSSLSAIYSRRVQFKSVVPPDTSLMPRTNLLVGISQVLASELVRYKTSSGYKVHHSCKERSKTILTN